MTARPIALLACVAVCAVAAGARAGTASDGGSATYTVTATRYDFVLFNSGTSPWQYFLLVGPAGTTFVGGGTISEASPRCAVGEPDGHADEIECGPLAASLAPPLVHLGFSATLARAVPCGSPFQLYVSATGAAPFSRASDAVFTGSCAATRAHALTPPTISGLPIVGRTLTASPPVWSATPTRTSYKWQRCTKTRCSSIRGATALRLRLTRRDRGRAVRIVATATVEGTTVTSRSGRVAVGAGR